MPAVGMMMQVAFWPDDVVAHHGTILPVKDGFQAVWFFGNANTFDKR
jgi:hypothetical protein